MTSEPLKTLYAIYGASGFGRGVMPLARAQLQAADLESAYELVFIDDAESAEWVNGHRVLSFDAFDSEICLYCHRQQPDT